MKTNFRFNTINYCLLIVSVASATVPLPAMQTAKLAKKALKVAAVTVGVTAATVAAGGATFYYQDRYAERPALLKAVKKCDVEGVKRLLAAGADPNVKGPFGMQPLNCVDKCRKHEPTDTKTISQRLLAAGANPNATDWFGVTLLMNSLDNETLATELLAAGADVNATVPLLGLSALHCATVLAALNDSPQDLRFISLLLAAGADVDSRAIGGHTPLMFAAKGCNVEATAMLLEAGANPKLQNWFGKSASEMTAETVSQKGHWTRCSETHRLIMQKISDQR